MIKKEYTREDKFVDLVNDIIILLADIGKNIHKSMSGNKAAARKARVLLVKLAKKGKYYRSLSIIHVPTITKG